MFKLILSSIFIATSVLAQPRTDSVMLRGPWGLNTASGDFTIQNGFGRVCHNFELSNGSLKRRLGYDSVSSYSSSSIDSMVGNPYGILLSDGRRYLMTDIAYNTGLGSVQVTNVGSKNLDSSSQVTTAWGTQSPTWATMYRDVVYFSNGNERMRAIDPTRPSEWENFSRSVPPLAPGELFISPISKTSGELNGEYFYAVNLRESRGQDSSSLGYVSQRTRVSNGRVYLALYEGSAGSSIALSDSVDNAWDSSIVKIYRTKANPGRLTKNVNFYYTGKTLVNPGGSVTYVDSIADASLSSSDTLHVATTKCLPSDNIPRYGQPRMLTTTTGGSTGMHVGTKGLGIYRWAYVCTYVDTLLGVESDTSRRLYINAVLNDSTNVKSVKLSILYSPVKHSAINIYRAPVYYIPDTLVVASKYVVTIGDILTKGWEWVLKQSQSKDTIILGPNDYIPGPDISGQTGWRYTKPTDTSITGFFQLVGQVKGSDTTFTDSLNYTQLTTAQTLRSVRPQPFAKGLVTYNNRIFSYDGSRLYISRLDTGLFSQISFIDINAADGDEITGIWATRDGIVASKNRSMWLVYQNDDGQWSRSLISNRVGCIAPMSVVQTPIGTLFMSEFGVYKHAPGEYLTRSDKTDLLSAPLNNFRKMPVATKKKAIGAYVDGKAMWCIGDTTYVYELLTDSWSTWSMKFLGTTLYNSGSASHQPFDTLYFHRGDKKLYRYGSSERDNGSDFTATWQSTPVVLDNWDKTASAVGVWVPTINSGYDKSTIRIINEQADTLYTRVDTSFGGPSNLPTPRFSRMSVGGNMAKAFRIDLAIQRLTPNVTANPITIDGIDLYYQRQGAVGE